MTNSPEGRASTARPFAWKALAWFALVGCGGHISDTVASGSGGTQVDAGAPAPSGGGGASGASGGGAGGASGSDAAGVGGVPALFGRPCKQSSDCGSILVCGGGLCTVECATAQDCPSGERCVTMNAPGVCLLASESSCSFNSDCAEPLICAIDRNCRNRCNVGRDCVSGMVCAKSGVCAFPDELDPSGDLPAR